MLVDWDRRYTLAKAVVKTGRASRVRARPNGSTGSPRAGGGDVIPSGAQRQRSGVEESKPTGCEAAPPLQRECLRVGKACANEVRFRPAVEMTGRERAGDVMVRRAHHERAASFRAERSASVAESRNLRPTGCEAACANDSPGFLRCGRNDREGAGGMDGREAIVIPSGAQRQRSGVEESKAYRLRGGPSPAGESREGRERPPTPARAPTAAAAGSPPACPPATRPAAPRQAPRRAPARS